MFSLLVLVATLAPNVPVQDGFAARLHEAGDDPSARAGVARWGIAHGLLAESIAELDLLLARDPDLAEARAVVAEAPLALTLPAAAERTLATRLVLFGAKAKPAYRELAAVRLAGLPREESAPELDRALGSPSSSVRAFAAFAARRSDVRAHADALVRRAVLDPVDSVRLESARALRDARDETLARRVEAGLGSGDARLRTNAAAALGAMGYRSSVSALASALAAAPASGHPGGTRAHIAVGSQIAYVRDFDVEIAQGASIGKPILGTVDDATVLDVRVGGTSVQEIAIEVPTLCRSLSSLTGERLPETASAWNAWWKSVGNRTSWIPPAPSGTGTGIGTPSTRASGG